MARRIRVHTKTRWPLLECMIYRNVLTTITHYPSQKMYSVRTRKSCTRIIRRKSRRRGNWSRWLRLSQIQMIRRSKVDEKSHGHRLLTKSRRRWQIMRKKCSTKKSFVNRTVSSITSQTRWDAVAQTAMVFKIITVRITLTENATNSKRESRMAKSTLITSLPN